MKTCTCGGEIGPRKPENDQAYHVQQWDEKMKRWGDMNHQPGTLAVCEEWLGYHTILKQQYRIVRRNDVVVREYGKGER